jgi:hypothetical protein
MTQPHQKYEIAKQVILDCNKSHTLGELIGKALDKNGIFLLFLNKNGSIETLQTHSPDSDYYKRDGIMLDQIGDLIFDNMGLMMKEAGRLNKLVSFDGIDQLFPTCDFEMIGRTH